VKIMDWLKSAARQWLDVLREASSLTEQTCSSFRVFGAVIAGYVIEFYEVDINFHSQFILQEDSFTTNVVKKKQLDLTKDVDLALCIQYMCDMRRYFDAIELPEGESRLKAPKTTKSLKSMAVDPIIFRDLYFKQVDSVDWDTCTVFPFKLSPDLPIYKKFFRQFFVVGTEETREEYATIVVLTALPSGG